MEIEHPLPLGIRISVHYQPSPNNLHEVKYEAIVVGYTYDSRENDCYAIIRDNGGQYKLALDDLEGKNLKAMRQSSIQELLTHASPLVRALGKTFVLYQEM